MSQNRAKTTITFFVNNEPFEASEHELTGGQLKQLAGVSRDYELFQVRGNETFPVGNEETLHIREDFHFRAIPAATFGTHGTSS